MFERITEKTFDEIFPLLESAFPVTELRMKEDQRALLKEPCYRLYGVRRDCLLYTSWFPVRQPPVSMVCMMPMR